MKNNLKFLLITVVVALAGVAIIGITGIRTNDQIAALTQKEEVQNGAVAGVQVQGEADLIINFGDKQSVFEFQVDQKTTAYDLLTRASIRENLILDTTEYEDLGILIDGINQYLGGQDNMYWFLYQNGEMTMQSIDNTLVKPGDKVELRFEISPY